MMVLFLLMSFSRMVSMILVVREIGTILGNLKAELCCFASGK